MLQKMVLQLIHQNHTVADTGQPKEPLDLQADLLHAWATWSGDPAAHAARWLIDGSPAGVTIDYELTGVLEPIEDETPIDTDELISDADHVNYKGVESDPEALAIIDGYVEKGWLA